MNPAALEGGLVVVLGQWLVIIGAAWLMGRAASRIGQPFVIGEILSGILLGPSVLGLLWPAGYRTLFPPEAASSLQLLAKVGLILLMLQVGMEIDFGRLKSRSRAVAVVSLGGLVAPMAFGLLIGPWLHRTFAPDRNYAGLQLVVCIALSITALPVMGRILLEMGLERTGFAAVAISAAAVDDVVGWILLAFASALTTWSFQWESMLLQVGGVLLFFSLLMWGVGPALRRIWRSIHRRRGVGLTSPFLALLLVVLLGCCVAAHKLGVFSLFGAFLLGVSLHRETGLVREWREKIADFVLVALVPVFFTYTGLRTQVASLSGLAWLGCGLVAAAAAAGKLAGCYGGARLIGRPPRESACVAALMNTRGSMCLVAVTIGAELGFLTGELFTMFVVMALVMTAMTGPLMKLFVAPPEAKDPPLPAPPPLEAAGAVASGRMEG